jgi:O-antigen/teichoic acid export membrane protein
MVLYSAFRLITAVCFFLLVRVLLDFLGPAQYGIWLTISTFTAWFSFFDFGFGNGLRNKLVTLFAENNRADAKIYISTVYFLFVLIFAGIYVLILIASFYIDWFWFFHIPVNFFTRTYLILAVNISFLGLCIKLMMAVLNAVLLADQKTALTEGINMAQQLMVLVIIFSLTTFIQHPVITIAVINAVVPIFVLLIASIILYQKKYKDIAPSIKHINWAFLSNLRGLGLRFFIIQIAGMVFFSSQNFIIAHFFQPASVTTYNVVFRYFGILTLISGVILAPFWSMVTKAYTLGEFDWIKASIKRLVSLWGGIIIIALGMVAASTYVYSIWLKQDLDISLGFTLSMALYTIVIVWNGIFANFINGVGKIKLQLYLAVFGMIIYLPLCYVLIIYCKLGLVGVSLGSTAALLSGSIILPIQYTKIVNHTATGIWNE